MRRPLTPRRALGSAAFAVLLLSALPAAAQNGGATPLARMQFDIVGVRLVVDPPVLTVPKNIPTLVNTSLVVPPSAGADVRDALTQLTAGAVVEAELRGPSLPPTRIAVVPGQPIPIPALALPGDYFLDGIRLARNGQTILDATGPDGRAVTSIPIRVINEVFVTSVTSRPMTLEEIRDRGILIDGSSYQAVNFQVAFNIDGQPFTISMPSVLPTPELLRTAPDRAAIIRQVATMNQALAATETRLPPQFDRPGINFSIAALPFTFVPEDGDIPALDIPPVNGLVVIAGNVAFLNQFFKVAVLVANVAPDGSRLELRDVTGTVSLPRGLDGIAGTPVQPGDDPLRLARLDGLGVEPTAAIVGAGPDGVAGTADDITVIAPQQQGEGELLLEGLKEGGHTFDVAIEAVLDGLPSGPVRMTGTAAGAVFVRNPTFAVTVAHPRTIRSGETYDLYATVTNTSRSPANLVSLHLDPLAISGAQLLTDPAVSFETLPAGESATARFTLRAQRTGEVTFTSFTGEASSGGGIRLVTGIGERDVPLAPNSIVLPRSAGALPQPLVAAAQRVLGQAFSIATAPADALPQGVLFVRRQTVVDRGLALAEAGERVEFGEPLGRVLQDLLLDWLGHGSVDAGFDQLLRQTAAGSAFMEALSEALAPGAIAGALEYQRAFAQAAAARPEPHVSAVAAGPAGVPAPALTITRADGTAVRRGEPGTVTMPGAAALLASSSGTSTAMAVLSAIEPLRHVFEFAASAAGTFDLGIVIPGEQPGTLRQLRYAGVTLAAGGVARVEIDLAAPSLPSLAVDTNGDGTPDSSVPASPVDLADAPPQVLDVRQLVSSFREAPGNPLDPATYGLLVAVLFDKPVTSATAEAATSYAVAGNEVIGARLQNSGRLAYLYLRQPLGGLTPRALTVSGIQDGRGGTLLPATRTIASPLTDGGRVFGQVREAGGQPVPDALLRLTVVLGADRSFDVATIRVDRNGSFDFDFVPRVGQHFVLTAQHPVTRDLTTATGRLRGAGEQLLLNPTFTGRGIVRGRLLAADGVTPVPSTRVALIPGAVLGSRGHQTTTNAAGEFTFADMPVGIFTLTASDGGRGFVQVQGLVERAGQTIVQDLVLVTAPDDGGRLGGRVFLADGATPARGFIVYAGQYNRGDGRIAAVESAVTDDDGSFTFARTLPPGAYDVVAVDPATSQVGATAAAVAARLTTVVSIVLEAQGAVEGVVFNALGQPVPGAVVAGGAALVTADANGFFRIDGVPAGARTIEAGDPVTRRRGAAAVTVAPGSLARVQITLEARATITGRVLDANGNPMPRVSVRLPVLGGYTFVFTNSQGVYTFPDLPLGTHLIQAPGPSVDSLVSFMETYGMDPASAFTSGDAPAGTPPPASGDRNAVLAAYQRAVQSFFSVDESILTGLPMAVVGGFGWNRVELFQDSTTIVADVRFLPQGQVAGRTEDAAGRPAAALVRVTGLAVSNAGFPRVAELGRMTSDAATGVFSFGGIPRFDLATFQSAAVRSGDFTLEAAQPFSPVIAAHRGQLTPSTPDLSGVVLRFPGATETNGTVSGAVSMPDGTAAPAGTEIRISFGDLTVLTAPDGRFVSLLPIPAGTYTITAVAPNGLRGQARAIVPAGGNVDVQLRLLGIGATTISVRRPNGVPVANALVRLERGTFPGDQADGRTDASGVVRFVNITEGPVAIIAEEDVTGLSGRASGAIVRGEDVAIPVVIRASGRVTGTFLSADALQPIPFAEVSLSAGSVRAFGSTGADGRFELPAIPVGGFTVHAHDPLTGRAGQAAGELAFEGQSIDLTIVQAPRGTVAGVVLNADGATPVPAARVRIVGDGAARTDLHATARADGGFRFEGVTQGTYHIEAEDPVSGFTGRASGEIDREGAFVETNVTLEPFGALRVAVQDHTGAAAGNASVTITGPGGTRTAAVAPDGAATFDHLRLGAWRIVARSLADSGSAGEAQATVDTANATAAQTVRLRGSGAVTVRVLAADGTTPVASARVVLQANAASGSNPPGAAATTSNGFTDSAGNVTFANVPVGDFFARGEAGALAGLATGTVAAPGTAASVTVRLGASGGVSGRVLLPDGVTPAVQSIVTLRFQPQTQQSGVLQVTTGVDGTFAFGGIPLGTITVSAFEVATSGVGTVTGAIGANGQVVALGDLVLDNAGPRVLNVTPADRAAGVQPDALVTIAFSEPMQPQSIVTGTGADANVVLLNGSSRVAVAAPVFADGNRTLTLRPAAPLTGSALYTVSIAAGPDAPRDEANFTLAEPLVSTFRVRDVTPPAVVSASPAPEAVGVLPEATVRFSFTEPVATAAIVVRDAAGALVPGTSALTAGNTAAVFAPLGLLQPNTSYTAALSAVADAAGNALAGVATTRFFTVDTIAPTIAALQVTGTPRAGSTVSVQALVAAADTARVEFRTSAGFASADLASPFSASVPLPAGAPAVTILATAFDASGNRSSTVEQVIAIQADTPPVVVLTNATATPDVRQGQVLSFDVRADDDAALAHVLFSSVGAAAVSTTRAVPGNPTTFTTAFTVQVPADAPSGSALTVQAAAVDALGQHSAPASLAFTVTDGVRPALGILSPVNDAQVAAGQIVAVTFDASDDAGLASVAVACNPALAGCESRTLAGAPLASRQTFSIQLPADVQAPASIALVVRAVDAAGNQVEIGRTLRLIDAVAPVVTALTTANGATQVLAGTTASLRATVADAVGVTSLVVETAGAVVSSRTVPVSPALLDGQVPFDVAVPPGLANGATIDVRVTARDAAGNGSPARTLTLSVGDTGAPQIEILAPPAGTQAAPGTRVTLTVRATDDVGVARVLFEATGSATRSTEVVLPSPLATAQTSFDVDLPADAAAGDLVLTARAVDTAGNTSAAVSRSVSVLDGVAPSVQITAPPAGAQVDPRTPVAVHVSAADAVGVTQITFSATGAATASETRTVAAAPAADATFSVPFEPVPPRGGRLEISVTARDAAGNASTVSRTIAVLDVVAPDVQSTTPASGATGVDRAGTIVVRFTEPMDPATLPGAVLLRRDGTPVAVTAAVDALHQAVTLTPAAPLAAAAAHTIVVGTAARDAAGLALAAERTFTFTTASTDIEGPRVTLATPADGAVNVRLDSTVDVTFDEPLDAGSVSATAFRVEVDGAPVAGTRLLTGAGRTLRFTAAEPWPAAATVTVTLTSGITDAAGNPLADGSGAPVAQLAFSFTTTSFGITSPAGDSVVEDTTLLLEARAANAAGIATVVFTVNGAAQPAAAAPDFSRPFTVPAAATTPSLTVRASARDAQNVEIASDERTVAVVVGLRAAPSLLGVPVGGTAQVRFTVTSPLATDLPIDLRAGNAALVTFPLNPVVLPAGATEIAAVVAGAAEGQTAIFGDSARGSAVSIVSVSPIVPGATLTPLSPAVGMSLSNPPSAGLVVAGAAGTQTVRVRLLTEALGSDVPVTVVSSNAAVATATGGVLQAGQLAVDIEVTTLGNGVATLIIRAGGIVRSITVIVGPPAPGTVPVTLAPAAGVSISSPASVGQIIMAPGSTAAVAVALLGSAAAGETAVTVESSDPTVATATAAPIAPGGLATTLNVHAAAGGVVTFILRAGGEVRSVTVFVGAPPDGRAPVLVAAPIGVSVSNPASAAQIVTANDTASETSVLVLAQPAAAPVAVSVSSDQPSVASATADAIVAGSRATVLRVSAGSSGIATLTLRAGAEVRTVKVYVGDVPADQRPVLVAPPAGVSVAGSRGAGTLIVQPGTPVASTLLIQLGAEPFAATMPVTVSSAAPGVATIAGAAVAHLQLFAGERVLALPLTTNGAEGSAIITFEFGGERRQLLVVVGDPPLASRPALTAPVVGVRIGG